MFIPVLAVFVTVTASCLAEEKAEMHQIEDLMADTILDEIADDNDESAEVSAAVRYMIPVPIRVVVPVPQPQPIRQPQYPERQRYPPERDPIVAVPIGLTPGGYGRRPSWRPIGPPVIAVPVGSATRYPLPERDDDDFERRALASPQAAATIRKSRSIKNEFKADDPKEEELTSDTAPKEVPVIQRAENPLKVSAKSGHKGKLYRPKRQLDTYTIQRGSYYRPARVLVPAQSQHIVVAPVSVPRTQVVPVPVYVPVPVDTTD